MRCYVVAYIRTYKREQHRANLYLCSIAFSFEDDCLSCFNLVIKMALMFQVVKSYRQGQDDSDINSVFS